MDCGGNKNRKRKGDREGGKKIQQVLSHYSRRDAQRTESLSNQNGPGASRIVSKNRYQKTDSNCIPTEEFKDASQSILTDRAREPYYQRGPYLRQ